MIKVEPAGRKPDPIPLPLEPGQEEPDRSWFWESYCFNKRGITLDIQKLEGAELLKRLASDVDFLMISSGLGYMESLGVGYEDLSKANPRLVIASMTPFGESGPYSGYKATDLVSWAMGGMAYISGDLDRAPVRITFPQAELHAGAQAVVGSMCGVLEGPQLGGGAGCGGVYAGRGVLDDDECGPVSTAGGLQRGAQWAIYQLWRPERPGDFPVQRWLCELHTGGRNARVSDGGAWCDGWTRRASHPNS